MNLRVDLILSTEQRSASRINIKSFTRIVVIVVPVLVGLVIASIVLGMWKLGNEVKEAETHWAITEPKLERARALAKQVKANEIILKELEGWEKTNMDWHKQLLGLQQAVPSMIQLNGLRISHAIQLVGGQVSARVFSMTISGTATGRDALGDVQNMKSSIETGSVFSSFMEEVNVTKFAAPTRSGAKETDRTFQIDCTYKPRNF